jgi:enolase
MKVSSVKAIQVLDSRGNPTVRAFLTLDNGQTYSSSVPSGASTGKYEALELRDGNKDEYLGLGVTSAVNAVTTTINSTISGMDISDPNAIDTKMLELDGTENKSKLGANAILAVSQAATRAAAGAMGVPLWKFIHDYHFSDRQPGFPRLMVNVINGGKHANWNFDIQEFMIITSATQPHESVQIASEIFHNIGKMLKKQGLSILVGDEGGYSPALNSNESAFETIIEGATAAGYTNTKEYHLAIDAAASEFFQDGKYILKKDNREITGADLVTYYREVQKKYSVYSFEDPFDQDDWENFTAFNKDRDNYIVVGDDLTVTNPKIIQKGIDTGAASAIIIKPNQIGSILETVQAIKLAQSDGWKIAIANRSGETEDSFIADLSYGSGADFIKTGSMSRSDRTSKYNRLLEIENNL